MPVYAYMAKKQAAVVRGTITADTPRQARDDLRARGLAIRDLVRQDPRADRRGLSRYLLRRHSAKVTGLLQEISTLLAAGIPLLEALETITRQHTGRFQQAILMLRDTVTAGGSLAEAMSQQPALFDDLCLNIVEVGENAGTLDTALRRLVAFRRRTAGLKNRVASALVYPCIVMAIGMLVSLFLMTYVVPNLLTVLIESGRELPLATRVVKSVSDLLINGWWAIAVGAAVLLAGLTAVLRSDSGSMRWHRLQLRIPVIGELIQKQGIARTAMVLATLLKSDVVFVKAIQIGQRTLSNRVLRDALVACEKAVVAGKDIAPALESTRAFPPLVIQVFAVGQASGRLETMLEDLAEDYDTQVDIMSSRLTSLLEPIMMIVLAIVVGFIAFATILPILEAGDVL
ncbi:MAG: type II secretion system F family protein [Phycisphaeraceae bacterium]